MRARLFLMSSSEPLYLNDGSSLSVLFFFLEKTGSHYVPLTGLEITW